MPDWMIDELIHAGPEHLDPQFVEGYDRKQGRPSPDQDLQALHEMGVLHEDSTVVDLGTGTGVFALAVAARCRRVVAVDVSGPMLERLSQTAQQADVTNVECVRAGFLSYQHRGAPADVVYSRNALHQLPDFWKGVALHRIAEILRPGGVLRLRDLVYDFTPAEAPEALERWMSDAALVASEGYTREDFVTHVRTEFSTYRWLLEPLLEVAGFAVVDSSVTRRIYATYSCVKR